MKYFQQITATFCSLLITINCFSQGAAINTSGVAADPSAILDISSVTSGVLIPRMTKFQKNSINLPATGLMVYQTDDTTGFWFYNGNQWKQMGDGTGGSGLVAGSNAGNTLYWDGSQWVDSPNIFNKGGSVGINTNTPDSSAAFEINSTTKGLLLPRMTTAERNAISNPARGLQIYNLDCDNLDYFNGNSWVAINPTMSAGVVITSNKSGSVCEGTNVVFTATPVNGGNLPFYQWKVNGINVGANVNIYSDSTLIDGDIILCELTSNEPCFNGNTTVSNPIYASVLLFPTVADAGSDQNSCDLSYTTLAANTPSHGTGVWSVVSGNATITDPYSPTTVVTNLSLPGTVTLRWTISNPPCDDSYDEVVINNNICFDCGVDILSDTRDGNSYQTVKIGSQCWMKENLKYLPVVHDASSFSSMGNNSLPGYGVYSYDGSDVNIAKNQSNYSQLGVLYNWFASASACPTDWHVPSDDEWKTLEKFLGMSQSAADATGYRGSNEGYKLKSNLSVDWPNGGKGDNTSGFKAVTNGYRTGGGSWDNNGSHAYFWTASEELGTLAWKRYLYYSSDKVYRDAKDKKNGYAIRCIRD